ncbi:MAG: hypothetical protein CVV27_00175 [Candidatus Melainabacteria bacterium HGW-Melainabacteria-1]|nr:MAG: hypothetical protein CVV27_00175 [Candidatus Melainabacteria bacterium HGW-Melainabacteria-1]
MKNPMSMALIATAVVVLGLGAMTVAPKTADTASNQAELAEQQAVQTNSNADLAVEPAAMRWNAYNAGLDSAKSRNKYVMVQFYATWCGYCKKMDQEVFTDSKVLGTLDKHFVPIRVVESSEQKVSYQGKSVSEKELTAMHGVQGFPTMVFMNTEGEVIGKIPGYVPPEEMNGILGFISSESYKKMDFPTYKAKFMKS